MEERCIICGAVLVNSTDGIGCGCREMLKKCTYIHMKNNKDRTSYYEFWNVESVLYMEAFKKFANHVTFKSSFKKSFVPSVIAFYDKKGYVSKKQLEIVKQILDDDWSVEAVEESIPKARKYVATQYQKLHYDEIVKMTHKMWARENKKDC